MTSIGGYSPYAGAQSMYASLTGTKTSAKQSGTSTPSRDVVAEFLNYQKMTPEQKLRDAVLKKLGITEDLIKNLAPDVKKDIEEEIKQEMKAMIQNKMAEKGLLVDITV